MGVTAPAPRTRPAAARRCLAPSRLRIGLWPAAAVVGIVAELAAGGGAAAGRIVLDLLTGWTLIACGLLAWDRRPESRIGALMVVAGFAWFAGNFAAVLAYLHRGPLAHVVLGYPTGRLVRAAGAVAGAWYVAGAVEPLAESDLLTIALGVALVAAALVRLVRSSMAERRDLARAALAAAAVAAPLVVGSVLRLSDTAADFEDPVLSAYEVALMAAALLLLTGLLDRARERGSAVVVELGAATGAGAVRDALARALGDPSLEVGYWVSAAGGYVDEAGDALAFPDDDRSRDVTLVGDDGAPQAALVHEPGLLDDPGLMQRVSSALRVAVANARLQARARAQLEEVRASRARVVEQTDAQRGLIERRLQAGPERRLAALELALERARAAARPAAAEVLAEAGDELRRTRAELRELARGLQPPAVADRGLLVAVTELAARAPLPVDVQVAAQRLPPGCEATAYFVCSEALANVTKHADASHARIDVTAAGPLVRVAVRDDGRGGADPSGSGLRGLADRVGAAGGSFRVESPPGGGTRVLAELPLGEA